jgi:hypothetical protein
MAIMNSVDLCIIICAILFSGVRMFVPDVYKRDPVSFVEIGKNTLECRNIENYANVEIGKNTLEMYENMPMTEEYNNWLKQFIFEKD